jgi:restriction system protein
MSPLRPALDRSYHYPPEVLELLVDTIPRLIKSKAGLLEFFEETGAPQELIAEWRTKLRQDRMSVSKYHLARGLLRGLNALGDEARPVRHQVLSRLARHGDFSAGWEDDRGRAEELVARIRELAGETDAGTWQAACQEVLTRQATLETYHARLKDAEDRREALAALKRDLYQRRFPRPGRNQPSYGCQG